MKLKTAAAKLLLCALALGALICTVTQAHDPQDLILAQVGVDEKTGGAIPTALPFVDQTGKGVMLSRYFTGEPVILTLNYYSCPTLCPLVFKNLVTTIGGMGGLRLGRDFKIVVVSIDPDETVERAADKSSKTYAMLGTSTTDPGTAWPFLLGTESSIAQLAKGVGIRYSRAGKEFAHPNVLVIATPDGRISRYLYGMEQAPQDLKLALLEASGGNIGGSKILNRALLYCFHYDPVGKKYVLLASRIMTGAMIGVLLLTVCLLGLMWKREKKPVART